MSEKKQPPAQVGLKAIETARVERERAKHGKMSGTVWLVAGGTVLTTLIVARMVADRSFANEKEELLMEQRAAVKTVGAEWFPLRDRLEGITLQAAGPFQGDLVEPEAKAWDFRGVPGIYLRLRVESAKDAATVRKAAAASLKDGFTSCFLREPNPGFAMTAAGATDAGTMPEQPWNLRQAYNATKVLNDDWATGVKDAKEKMELRVFEVDYERAKRDQIPVTVDIVKKAQFFLLVLDEDVPEAKPFVTGDAGMTEEVLQQVPHPSRVHVIDLRKNKEIVRLRRTGESGFELAGEGSSREPEVQAAVRRQVNNCTLAQQVWGAIRPPAKSALAGDAGVPVTGGSRP